MKNFWNEYRTYITNNPEHLWFKRKLYGWGWTPATWQGWMLTLGYLFCVLALALTIEETATKEEVLLGFGLPTLALSLLFIAIAYKKGEKPKWQWGEEDHSH